MLISQRVCFHPRAAWPSAELNGVLTHHFAVPFVHACVISPDLPPMEPDPPSDPSLMGHAPPSDPPPMEIIRYLCTDSPTKTWRSCAEYLERWKLEKLQKSVADSMVIFRREMALNLVMCSCKLKARPPENIGQEDGKIYKLLENIYNGTKSYKPDDSNVPECSEGDRYSERQRVQHLLAYKCLCESGLHEGRPLSEELIKETHETLMFKLLNDKSESIDAGTYSPLLCTCRGVCLS